MNDEHPTCAFITIIMKMNNEHPTCTLSVSFKNHELQTS
jgi:hypothetical protein